MGLKKTSGYTVYNLKIKNQTNPEFQLVGKEGDKYIIRDTASTYEGILQNVDVRKYEYKNEDKYNLNLYFKDEEGSNEKVSLNFNSLALNILNTFANEEDLSNRKVRITVYEKDEQPKIYIELDGERGSWKYPAELVSKIYKAGDEKWIDMFEKDVKPKFKNVISESTPEEELILEVSTEVDNDDFLDMDDLPF